jgi:hypothetical protein
MLLGDPRLTNNCLLRCTGGPSLRQSLIAVVDAHATNGAIFVN